MGTKDIEISRNFEFLNEIDNKKVKKIIIEKLDNEKYIIEFQSKSELDEDSIKFEIETGENQFDGYIKVIFNNPDKPQNIKTYKISRAQLLKSLMKI